MRTVALTVRFGDIEFIDRITIKSQDLTSKLSGTYQSTLIAAQDYDNI